MATTRPRGRARRVTRPRTAGRFDPTVLDAVDTGVFVFDAEGRIVTMSRWARERAATTS